MDLATKWKLGIATIGIILLCDACTVIHKTPRHYPPHRHHVIVVAEQADITSQSNNRFTAEGYLAMTEFISYDNTK